MPSNRRLTYKKEDGKRNLNALPIPVEEQNLSETGPVVTSRLSSLYTKKEGTFSYALVCAISGGTKKEKDFLNVLIKGNDIPALRVVFISKDGQGLQPYQMQEKWAEIQTTRKISVGSSELELEAVDKVFLLSDVDEFYGQLLKILTEKKTEDVGECVISNPCFEVWLYYCYKNNPQEDLASLNEMPLDKRSQELKRLGGLLVPGGLNPIRAFELMRAGINHSKAHFMLDENGIPILFSTQMHTFAQYLIDVMNRTTDEYERFVKTRQEFRWTMKRRRI